MFFIEKQTDRNILYIPDCTVDAHSSDCQQFYVAQKRKEAKTGGVCVAERRWLVCPTVWKLAVQLQLSYLSLPTYPFNLRTMPNAMAPATAAKLKYVSGRLDSAREGEEDVGGDGDAGRETEGGVAVEGGVAIEGIDVGDDACGAASELVLAVTACTNIFASFTRTLTFANGSTAAS
eukprot:m.349979 g.349979  ORF g.349979 m.349979 type:complete len:177 (+) comp16156_c0_seq10:41-571(+)